MCKNDNEMITDSQIIVLLFFLRHWLFQMQFFNVNFPFDIYQISRNQGDLDDITDIFAQPVTSLRGTWVATTFRKMRSLHISHSGAMVLMISGTDAENKFLLRKYVKSMYMAIQHTPSAKWT